MASSSGESKGYFATFVERKPVFTQQLRFLTEVLIPCLELFLNCTTYCQKTAFKLQQQQRGKEFACHQSVEDAFGIKVYFAEPYSPWQKGSSENSNGLLREFYPKKMDLALVDQ